MYVWILEPAMALGRSPLGNNFQLRPAASIQIFLLKY